MVQIVGYIVMALGILLMASYVMRVVGGVRGSSERTAAFLDGALAAHDVVAGEELRVPFTAAGGAHAVWLDLALRAPLRLALELDLAVRVGTATVVDGTYPVTFDDSGDALGLLDAMPLEKRIASMPGSERVATVLRVARFEAPAGTDGELRVTVKPAQGVSLARGRVLVTRGEGPATDPR